MGHSILRVEEDSVAERFGLRPGDAIASIDGQPLLDEIDYQALTAHPSLTLEGTRADGSPFSLAIRKGEGEPLGLRFGESMALSPRRCRNKCVFCFVDQMPQGCRESLYVKDDDWRYSLMMGNFVTLTNVDEAEFDRILRRKPSPLYVSVHSTNPQLRVRMMGSRFAGDILEKLKRLGEAGIRFHCQIVVCPAYNDGAELQRTLEDLKALAPAAASVALVPVGMTRFRQGLAPLRPFTGEDARALLGQLAPFQEACRREIGTTFVFPSDELFCLAGAPIPGEEWYEHFPQIENGVGLLRLLESELEAAQLMDEDEEPPAPQRLLLATGVSAAPHLEGLARRFVPKGTTVEVLPIRNRFFGETITVAGLLTGGDVLTQLPQSPKADKLLITASMLRHEGDLFLDGMSLEAFRQQAPLPVEVVACDGRALYDAFHGRYEEEGE